MKKSRILAAMVMSVGLALSYSGVASAQAAFDDPGSSADDAGKLLDGWVDEDGDISGEIEANGVDPWADDVDVPSVDESRYLSSRGQYDSEGGQLRMLNCTSSTLTVETYNSDDQVLWIPYEKKNVGAGQTANLKCATSGCTLKVGGRGTYKSRSGPQVFTDDLHTTNSDYIGAGCGAYSY